MPASVRRILASLLAWVMGAAAAVGVGLLALSAIDTGLTSRAVAPLTTDVVANDSSEPAQASSSPQGERSATVGPSPAVQDRLVISPGGTAVVRCGQGGGAYLVTWSPEPGYRVRDVRRGPGAQVSVTFESGESRLLLSARCMAGVPEARVAQLDDDNHNRGHG